jgi:glyoxylate reductase
MKPRVLLTNRLPEAVMDRLAAESQLSGPTDGRPMTGDEILARLPGHDALLCTITDRIDATVLTQGGSALKVVANFGVGYNHIDVAVATKLGIQVTNTPGVLTDATADIAFGLILSTARRFFEGESLVRSGSWTGWSPLQLLGHDLADATLALIGFGRIGKAMASRARGFGMKVRYWNRTRLSEEAERSLDVSYGSIDELVESADFISLHIAYTAETHHLINSDRLGRMKRHAILVNTARGAVIDECALVEALRCGQIAGAGLDVFEREPALHPGLASLPNCTLLPHLGSATIGTRTRMGHMAVDDALAVCAGRSPSHPVNYPQSWGAANS